jgi:hypothetical protein
MRPLQSLARLSLLVAFTCCISSCEEPKYCSIHEHELSEKDVEISYGMPTFKTDYTYSYEFQTARDTSFANEFIKNGVGGGCIPGPETDMEVDYCSTCNNSYHRRLAANAELIAYWDQLPDSLAGMEMDKQQGHYEAWREEQL